MRADNGHAQEDMLETVGELGHPPSLNVSNMVTLRSIGQVEISDEASLDDLKTQVKYEGSLSSSASTSGKNKVCDLFCIVSARC